MKTLSVSAEVRGQIHRHLESGYPEEACGGLLGFARDEGAVEVVAAVPVTNSRDDERRRRYLIGPDDVVQLERHAEQDGLQVVGYYHSHPDAPAVPSDFDREHAWPWYVYLIAGVDEGRVVDERAWRLADDRRSFVAVEVEDR